MTRDTSSNAPTATIADPSQAARPRTATRETARVIRQAMPWIAAIVFVAVMPHILRSGTAHTVMSLMGITIIFALSFNLLLGQTGLLSFGHAVYYGIGAYFVVHFMNAVMKAGLPIPLILVPLVGGVAGLAFAIIFGWVSTKRAGTVFSMISLGLAELVGSSSLILRTFFGGEEGVSTDRTKLLGLFGFNFGPQIQMYYLIAAWCLLSAGALYALSHTPLGRMCNAVRDNPERAQFVGYNTQVVRFLAFCISGFFAGIAGGLAAINFELANAALFSAQNSGLVLLATFIGGIGTFIGPVLGSILVNYLQIMLSDVTEIWQLYFGILFIAVVMFAPGGLAGLLLMHRPLIKAGSFGKVLPQYALAIVPIAMFAGGLIAIIEMIHHLSAKSAEGHAMKVFGVPLNTHGILSWIGAIGLVILGGILLRLIAPRIGNAWDDARAIAREKGIVS